MEKQLRPSPANFRHQLPALVILIALSLLSSASTVTAYGVGGGIVEQELQSAIAALRSNGYLLFSNAIDTSDLRYQIPSGDAFTFFAPRDPNLFSLDMASHASVYVQILHYHVLPLRLSSADLRNLSDPGLYVQTLLPHYSLLIDHSPPPPPPNDAVSDYTLANGGDVDVTVDRVPISSPDLYLGSRIAIHGLDGILAPRFEFSDFAGELGFVHSVPRVSSPMTPAKKSWNSRSRKRGKRHEDHRHVQGRRGHRKVEDDEHKNRHGKFSKISRHLADNVDL